jgi:large repetitive protein
MEDVEVTMKVATKRTSLALAAAGALALAGGGPASADAPTAVSACGTVISAPGRYALADDLVNCAGDGVDIAAGDVTLLLNGHTISGAGLVRAAGVGTSGTLTNVTVLGPGLITNFEFGVDLRTTSSSQVRGVTAAGCECGALGVAFQFGFIVAGGTNNLFTGNTATGFAPGDGFAIAGSNNVFKGNDASNGNGSGFFLYIGTSGNEIRGNTASSNFVDGILSQAGSTGNSIRGNTALGNGVNDLEDDNPNCDSNIWKGNEFGTANQPCIQ